MATIPGASRFLSTAGVANVQGFAPSIPTVLSQDSSTASLLDSGRKLSVLNTGVSSSARALNSRFLSQSVSLGNELLSLGAGLDATIEGAQLQISALRAGLSDAQLAPSLRGQEVDTEA